MHNAVSRLSTSKFLFVFNLNGTSLFRRPYHPFSVFAIRRFSFLRLHFVIQRLKFATYQSSLAAGLLWSQNKHTFLNCKSISTVPWPHPYQLHHSTNIKRKKGNREKQHVCFIFKLNHLDADCFLCSGFPRWRFWNSGYATEKQIFLCHRIGKQVCDNIAETRLFLTISFIYWECSINFWMIKWIKMNWMETVSKYLDNYLIILM